MVINHQRGRVGHAVLVSVSVMLCRYRSCVAPPSLLSARFSVMLWCCGVNQINRSSRVRAVLSIDTTCVLAQVPGTSISFHDHTHGRHDTAAVPCMGVSHRGDAHCDAGHAVLYNTTVLSGQFPAGACLYVIAGQGPYKRQAKIKLLNAFPMHLASVLTLVTANH